MMQGQRNVKPRLTCTVSTLAYKGLKKQALLEPSQSEPEVSATQRCASGTVKIRSWSAMSSTSTACGEAQTQDLTAPSYGSFHQRNWFYWSE